MHESQLKESHAKNFMQLSTENTKEMNGKKI